MSIRLDASVLQLFVIIKFTRGRGRFFTERDDANIAAVVSVDLGVLKNLPGKHLAVAVHVKAACADLDRTDEISSDLDRTDEISVLIEKRGPCGMGGVLLKKLSRGEV